MGRSGPHGTTARRPSAGCGGLTRSELEVVRLVGKGLTDPGIGERRVIGRGTVKIPLDHVFATLGVATPCALTGAVPGWLLVGTPGSVRRPR